MVLWQHGYTPERRWDQTVVLDNFSIPPNDPLRQLRDDLIQQQLVKGRDPWDLCVVDSGLPMDTTLSIALAITEQDPSYLHVDKFSSLFQPDANGRLPALMRAEPALNLILQLVEDKMQKILNLHPRYELQQLSRNESLPYHLRQIHKLQLQELDILNKLLKTDMGRWSLYPSLRRIKKPTSPQSA